jgi:hypothetical protein
MWARPVVVDEELIEHRHRMAAAEDEKVIALRKILTPLAAGKRRRGRPRQERK